MTRVSDEDLGAFLDGELPPEARDALEKIIATDADVRARLDHMRAADAALQDAFPAPQTRLDDPLVRRIRSASKASGKTDSHASRSRGALMALAAGIAGLAVGFSASSRWTQSDPSMLSGAVRDALESRPSGETHDGVRVLFSFNTDDASPCRQFVTATETLAGEGVACRRGSDWRLVAWVESRPEAAGAFRTAAGDGELDAVVDRLDRSGPLSEEDERILLGRRWRAP